MKKLIIITAFGLAALIGCDEITTPTNPTQPTNEVTSHVTVITDSDEFKEMPFTICIGVENGYAGACPGALKDSSRMFDLLSDYSREAVLLQDDTADTFTVKQELARGARSSSFLVFYYSGHGGQSYSGDSSEADGKDEYICLYNSGMLDDDIWTAINAYTDVVLIFDCCHSQTMYRAPMFKTMKPRLAASRKEFNMICWSGCPDDTYSYGSKSGGELTNTLLKYFDEDMTYLELWAKVKNDSNLKKFEAVQQTIIGSKKWDFPVFTRDR